MSITPSIVASVTSGTGPLGVVFDASATTATGVSLPFHELYYVWSFGDSGSGNFTYGHTTLTSRNSAVGPVAAHLFDPTPGSGQQVYTVTLDVYDINGNTAQTTQQITVDDPNTTYSGTNTIAIANGAAPVAGVDGVPSGATVVGSVTSWATVMATYVASNKRVLLKHDDVFTGTTNTSLSGSKSNGVIGTYHSTYPCPASERAIVRNSGTDVAMIQIGTIGDFKIMDIEFDGESGKNTAISNAASDYTTLTMVRLNCHDLGGAVELSLDQSNDLATGVFLHDSKLQTLYGGSGAGGHGILVGCPNVSLQGNLFSNNVFPTEHLMRLQFLDRFVISHNQLDVSAADKEMIALRSPCAASGTCPGPGGDFSGLGLSGAAAHTRKGVISRNYTEVNIYAGLHVTGINTGDSWVVEDVIVEQNFWTNVSEADSTLIRVDGGAATYGPTKITIRNELVISPDGTSALIDVGQLGASDPTAINCYNNTLYSSSASFVDGFKYYGSASGTVTNNICYAPNVASPDVIDGSPTAGTNSTDSQAKNNRPWTDTTPTIPSDFQLNSAEYADAAGDESIPVFDDYFGNIRNLANMDIGFHAFTQGSLPGGGGPAPRPSYPIGSMNYF